jgi:hypothetical protein
VDRLLGDAAWCISYKDSACRCFGFLVSRKRYVFTIDDDCFVAKNPSNEVRGVCGMVVAWLPAARPALQHSCQALLALSAECLIPWPRATRLPCAPCPPHASTDPPTTCAACLPATSPEPQHPLFTRTSTRWSSTSKTCSPRRRPTFSTRCTTPIARAPTLCVATPSA